MQSGCDSQLDPNESLPPIMNDSKVDLAIRHILELQEEIRQLSSIVAELQQTMEHLTQYHKIQPTGPQALGMHTDDSCPSDLSFMTAPSRNNSGQSDSTNDYVSHGNSQMGINALNMHTAVTDYSWRRHNLPPVLHQPSHSDSQLTNKHSSGNGNLQGIPEREDSLSCSQLVCLPLYIYQATVTCSIHAGNCGHGCIVYM